MIEKVIGTPKCGLILLSANGATSETLFDIYSKYVNDVLIYSLAGPANHWYPITSEYDSIRGIAKSVKLVKGYVKRMSREVPHSKIFIAGHSAGAIMALQVAAHTKDPLGGVHMHCGGILDIDSLPESNGTPLFIVHSENDNILPWDENYIPMKNALIAKNYNCHFVERKNYGHTIRYEDVKFACKGVK